MIDEQCVKIICHLNDISASQRFTTGENLYLHRSTDPRSVFNPDSSIKVWAGEHKQYRYEKMQYRDFYKIGHYTQVIHSCFLLSIPLHIYEIIMYSFILLIRHNTTSVSFFFTI